jgi:hypothetical protein
MRNAAVASTVAVRREQPLTGAPANEAAAEGAPESTPYVLTLTQKKRCATQAAAIDAATLLPLPPYLAERLVWMGMIQAMAWRDREAFARVDDGEAPMTADELEEFGRHIEFARDVEAGRTLPLREAGDDVTKMSDGALWAEMLAHRGTLCNALALRSAKDPSLGATATAIRGARGKAKIARAMRQILKVCEGAELAAWLAKLPKGEGAARTRLQTLLQEWTRRRAKAPRARTVASDDTMRRAFTLASEPLARVLRIGRYLTRDVADRAGDYGAFTSPRSRKRAKASDAEKPKDPIADPAPGPTD